MNDETKQPLPTPSRQPPIIVPRNLEVLLQKAAVNREFRELLVKDRSRAAAAIQLKLEPAEEAMLEAIPSEQLQLIINETGIPLEQWRPSDTPKGMLVTGIRPGPAYYTNERPGTPSGQARIAVPRGIEVLLKKAAVDPEFRQLLMDQRGGAAAAIELELHPAEKDMLQSIPAEQLARLISQTVVPREQRRVFLGRAAAAMLVALGAIAVLPMCAPAKSRGIRPDRPGSGENSPNDPSSNAPPASLSRGISPERP